MTDTSSDTVDNVNEAVVSEWVEDTTPFDRIRTVMKRVYDAQSAAEIADRARTTPTTARKHLQQLAKSGFVEVTSESGRDATLYRRSSESLVLEQARDILAETDTETLVARINEMQAEIDTYREEFAVESPEDTALRDVDIDPETLRDWQTTRRNLGIAKAALAFSEAEDAVQVTQTG